MSRCYFIKLTASDAFGYSREWMEPSNPTTRTRQPGLQYQNRAVEIEPGAALATFSVYHVARIESWDVRAPCWTFRKGPKPLYFEDQIHIDNQLHERIATRHISWCLRRIVAGFQNAIAGTAAPDTTAYFHGAAAALRISHTLELWLGSCLDLMVGLAGLGFVDWLFLAMREIYQRRQTLGPLVVCRANTKSVPGGYWITPEHCRAIGGTRICKEKRIGNMRNANCSGLFLFVPVSRSCLGHDKSAEQGNYPMSIGSLNRMWEVSNIFLEDEKSYKNSPANAPPTAWLWLMQATCAC